MTNVQSKLTQPIFCTCKEFQHQWADRCINAVAGQMLAATPYCLRVYTVVYMISLLMRQRIPTLEDLKKTLRGILQSSAFLITNAYTFTMYNCLLRNLLGHYNMLSVSFIPAFLASFTAILVERPARRPLLTLYVANLATESIWRMAESRGIVRSIPQGQTLIFGVSVSIMLYLYRLGLHKTQNSCKDSLFKILQIFVGKGEEGPMSERATAPVEPTPAASRPRPPLNFRSISGFVAVYGRFVESLKQKHKSCPHKENCIRYAVYGGIRPFVGGVSLQVALKLLLNIKRIAQMRMQWRKTFVDRNVLKLGVFLGSFSFLYKSVSCILRHSFGRDDPRFAIPAGLIGSVAFSQYPDVTVALYVMWKMLQIVYNLGVEKGIVPEVNGFTLFLYSFCTAMLFHTGILEPKSLRPSYYKFLQTISGERLSKYNMQPFDVLGLNSSAHKVEIMRSLNIVDKSPLPKYSLSTF